MATIRVGELRADIVANATDFVRETNKARAAMGQMSGRARQLSARMDRTRRSLDAALAPMRRMLSLVVALAAPAALARVARNAINVADSIGKLAESVGLSVEGLQELQNVFELAGASVDQANRAFVTFTSQISEVQAGTGELYNALRDVNAEGLIINVRGAQSTREAIDAVLTGIASARNEQEALNIAVAAFGRRAAPAVVVAANNYRDLLEQQAQVPKLTTDAATAAANFQDRITLLGRAWRNAFLNIILRDSEAVERAFVDLTAAAEPAAAATEEVAMQVVASLNELREFAKQIGNVIAQLKGFGAVVQTFFQFAGFVALVGGLSVGFKLLAASIRFALGPVIGVLKAFKDGASLLVGFITGTQRGAGALRNLGIRASSAHKGLALIVALLIYFEDEVEAAFNAVRDLVSGFTSLFTASEEVNTGLEDMRGELERLRSRATIVGAVIDNVRQFFVDLRNAIADLASTVADFVANAWQDLRNAVVDFAKEFRDVVVNAFKEGFEAITEAFLEFFEFLTELPFIGSAFERVFAGVAFGAELVEIAVDGLKTGVEELVETAKEFVGVLSEQELATIEHNIGRLAIRIADLDKAIEDMTAGGEGIVVRITEGGTEEEGAPSAPPPGRISTLEGGPVTGVRGRASFLEATGGAQATGDFGDLGGAAGAVEVTDAIPDLVNPLQEWIERLEASYDPINRFQQHLDSAASNISSSVTQAFESVVFEGESLGDALVKLGISFLQEIVRLTLLNTITDATTVALTKLAAAATTAAAAQTASAGTGVVAHEGGRVYGGQDVIVGGSAGPEVFRPDRNGYVTPLSHMGGGDTLQLTQNISAGVSRPDVFAAIEESKPGIVQAAAQFMDRRNGRPGGRRYG